MDLLQEGLLQKGWILGGLAGARDPHANNRQQCVRQTNPVKKDNLLYVASTYADPEKGQTTFKSYVCSFSLHFYKSLLLSNYDLMVSLHFYKSLFLSNHDLMVTRQ
jgi:hypothetical protein